MLMYSATSKSEENTQLKHADIVKEMFSPHT